MKCQSHLQGSQQEHDEDGNIVFSPMKKRSVRSSVAPRGRIKEHNRSRWGWYSVFYKTELERITSTLDLFQMFDASSTSLCQEYVPKERLYTKKK